MGREDRAMRVDGVKLLEAVERGSEQVLRGRDVLVVRRGARPSLTQAELADRAGYGREPNVISLIEMERVPVSQAELARLILLVTDWVEEHEAEEEV